MSKGLTRPGTGGPPSKDVSMLSTSNMLLLTVSKCHYAIHCIEDHGVVNHAIIVKFAQVLDLGEPALVEFEIILLQAKCNAFENGVNNRNHEALMISVESTRKNRKEMYVTVLDFPRPGEYLLENSNNLRSLADTTSLKLVIRTSSSSQ